MQSLDIKVVLLLIGSAQGIFLGFVILLKKQKPFSLANFSLSALVFILSFQLLLGALLIQKEIIFFRVIFPFIFPMFLLIGPFIYFYSIAVVYKIRKVKPIFFLHFIPFIIFTIFFVVRVFFFSNKILPWEILSSGATPFGVKIFMFLDFFSRLLYTIFSVKILVTKKNKVLDKNFDYNILLLLLTLSFFSLLIYTGILIFSVSLKIRILSGIFFSLMIYVLGYFYIKEKSFSLSNVKIAKNKLKYARSGLSEEKKREIYVNLIKLMSKEKYYLHPDISANFLSKKLNITSNNLSQVLNEVIGKNFYEFINHYRIEEAKKLLSDHSKELSILSIGYEVGFKSKTTFNTVFKKIVNMSPSEFRKKAISE